MAEKKRNLESVNSELSRIVGASIYSILIHEFYLDFVVNGSIQTIIRIQKEFKFSLSGTELEQYNIGKSEYAGDRSCRFIEFIGRSIEGYTMEEHRFEVRFVDKGIISVMFDPSDFESIEFIGTSGPHRSKLEFYYVL